MADSLYPAVVWECATLPGGLQVAAVQQPQCTNTLVRLFVACGSRFEAAAECGLSHLVEHVLFQGNAAYSSAQLLEQGFEAAGCLPPEAMTGTEESEYSLLAPPEALQPALEHLAGLVRTPLFQAEHVAREKGVVLEELLDAYNEAGQLTDPEPLANALLWGRHPLGQPVGGQPASIRSLEASQLAAWHRRFYQPWRCVLGLCGPLPPQEAFAQVARHFADWQATHPPARPPEPQDAAQLARAGAEVGGPGAAARRAGALEAPQHFGAGPRLCWQVEPESQLHLLLRFPGPGYNDPRALALSLLLDVLDSGASSRLQTALREEDGLLYYLGADYCAFWDAGYLEVQAAFHPRHLQQVAARILGIFAALCAQPPSPAELQAARRRRRILLWQGQDSPQALLDRFAWPLLYSRVREANEDLQRIEALTPLALQSLAQALFVGNRLHGVLSGPLKAEQLNSLAETLTRWSGAPCQLQEGLGLAGAAPP